MKNKRIVIILLAFLICVFAFSFYSFHEDARLETKLKSQDVPQEELRKDEIKTQEVPLEKKTTATILAAGDVMFHEPQVKGAYDALNDTYDFKNSFKYVKKYIEAADLALVNFETVTAGKELGYHGYPNFNSPVEVVEALDYAGFDVISTANNHSIDQGKRGIISTIDAIENLGLKNVGTYKESNSSILIEKVNDINIGILSYTYGCNGMEYALTEEELNYMVNIIDEEKIKEDIFKAKEIGSDVIVVFIHWGNEYQMEPSEEQIELGQKLVEWGANIVFGSHPHVVQKSEIININGKNSVIMYSMGNFLSNQRRETINNKYTEDGVMVNIEVEKDHLKNETIVKSVSYIPTWVNKYYEGGKAKYEIMPTNDFLEEESNEEVLIKIKESYKNTMNKMSQL